MGDVSRTDTGYLKSVPAAANTVTGYLVEGGRRFVDQFFRRRVRLRCDGELATAASAGTLKELVPEARQSSESCGTCSQDLGLLKRTETQLSANSCFWLWLIRHAGWVDSRFRVETHGATPCQDAYDSAYTSQILPFGELDPLRIPLPHTRRLNQNRTIYGGDSGWDKGVWNDDWTKTMRTSSSLTLLDRLHELSPGFLQTSAQMSLC